MTECRININHKISVKLTDRGREILNKHIAEDINICNEAGIPTDNIPSCYKEDSDGYLHLQLWHFMNIFGPYLANGAPLVIEKNEIIFDKHIDFLKEIITEEFNDLDAASIENFSYKAGWNAALKQAWKIIEAWARNF